MKYIEYKHLYNTMKIIMLLAICACCVLGLKTLKKEQIENKYEIGTISDLYFSIHDKIFFRSDDDIFGFISQKDGSVLQVFELEPDEEIIKFTQSYEVAISKNKDLNIFLTSHSVYKPLTKINNYLHNHSDYTKIIDFLKGGDLSLFILTDKYLMKLSFENNHKGQNAEQILVELKNSAEQFVGLVPFFNAAHGKEDTYVISRIKQGNASKLCFKKVSNLSVDASCFQVPNDHAIVDIVESTFYIYIQFEKYALAYTTDLRFVAKIDSKPLHYFNGLISLSQKHQFYDPYVKTVYNTIIIAEHETISLEVKTLKVQSKSLTLQDKQGQTFADILSIPKETNQNPRKAWSFTAKDNATKFRLYVEFEDGRLVCYSIDRTARKYEQVWRITTMEANKVVTGQIEAKDIQGEDEKEEQDIEDKPNP